MTSPQDPRPIYDSGQPVPGIWDGPGAQARRILTKPPIDRPIFRIPTGEREPESDPPQTPAWINSNKPGFNEPPVWSEPVAAPFTACVPWYGVAQALAFGINGCMTIPHDRCLVVKGLSYEALNANLFDTFQFQILVNNSPLLTVEDMYIDNTIGNPAQQYAMSGHYRHMPCNFIADHDSILCATGILLGPILLGGPPAPGVFPGLPITVGNDCQMKLILYGWLAPLRDVIDGGPRPTDLGDMDFADLDADQSRGGMP